MAGAEPLWLALALATLAGASIPLGAWLGSFQRLFPDWLDEEMKHSVAAFGGGALFSAIALVLVPEGAERLAALPALGWFVAGGLVFYAVDRALAARGGSAAQFMAMMLDYVPEAMALGAMLAGDPGAALLIAALIALQNLPEGFNAFREMQASTRRSTGRLLVLFALMVPVGPAAAWVGLAYLEHMQPALGAIMLFSGGGILYLLFEDVAPQAVLRNNGGPPLGAVAGFAVGLAGHLAQVG